jgi:hypothetical protein
MLVIINTCNFNKILYINNTFLMKLNIIIFLIKIEISLRLFRKIKLTFV